MSIVKLILAALFPVIVAVLFDQAEKKTQFQKINYIAKQIIIGIIFGLIAITGTEWGIKTNGVVLNVRDAAPLISGLMFGGPAGIIAGIIGGAERWFAVYWGAGTLTRVACSVSTCLAGFYAALVRKSMLDNKRPTWGMALGIGVVMEIFHLSMVMVTNVNDATVAVAVIDACFLPMVIANGLSVMFASMALSFLSNQNLIIHRGNSSETPIFVTIQQWLLAVLAIAFALTMIFDYRLETNMMVNQAKVDVEDVLVEIGDDIRDESDSDMIRLARIVGREIAFGRYNLDNLLNSYDITEIVVVDDKGIVIDSNNENYIGFDMASGEQSAAFMVLLDGSTDSLAQEYGPIASDPSIKRKFAGVAINNGKKFVQIAYDANAFQKQLSNEIKTIASNRRIGDTGFVLVFDGDDNIVSKTKLAEGISINKDDIDVENIVSKKDVIITEINGEEYYTAATEVEGYTMLAIYPKKEAQLSRDVSLYVSLFSMLILFSIMFAVIYILIKRVVVNQITEMTKSLSNISNGDLNEVVNVRSNQEFSSLSDDINTTVDTLKHYIAEAAARIDKELEFAKAIQHSALPAPISLKDSYNIYARMDAAKTVGGDFYDFYITKENTLNFLIADVSGKGIPAAMFMMRAKSVLRSITESGYQVNEVFTRGNNALCEGNDADMFVTAWQGGVDLSTGKMYFANAGHNLPVVKHRDGDFAFLEQKINLVLAGMEGIPYRINEYDLQKGDIIYLYTDGVTEATNNNNELYGDERLLTALNSREYSDLKDLCDGIKEDIDKFVDGADQFDDITMVAFEYLGE